MNFRRLKYVLPLITALLFLSLVVSGCGNTNQSVTFSQLIYQADKYNGKTVIFEAFYFAGFEISALAESVGPANFEEWRIVPKGDLIWVEKGISEELFNKLSTQNQTPSGYAEHIGKLKVTGQFETGGKFGHLDAYQYQIAITSAELLEWSPPPAATPTVQNSHLQVKVTGSSGQPLAGAKVVSEEQPEGQLKVTGMTDASGTVTFNDIQSGEYRFYVSVAGYTQKNDIKIAVISGQTTSITVDMTEPE